MVVRLIIILVLSNCYCFANYTHLIDSAAKNNRFEITTGINYSYRVLTKRNSELVNHFADSMDFGLYTQTYKFTYSRSVFKNNSFVSFSYNYGRRGYGSKYLMYYDLKAPKVTDSVSTMCFTKRSELQVKYLFPIMLKPKWNFYCNLGLSAFFGKNSNGKINFLKTSNQEFIHKAKHNAFYEGQVYDGYIAQTPNGIFGHFGFNLNYNFNKHISFTSKINSALQLQRDYQDYALPSVKSNIHVWRRFYSLTFELGVAYLW